MKIVICALFLCLTGCATEEARHRWEIAGAAFLIGAGAYAATHNGGGAPASGQPIDYDWDWDFTYINGQQRGWTCRGVQSGQYADQSHCLNMAQTDWRWPNN